MAKRFITFGSIDAFRTVIKNITHEAQYVGYDEELKRPQLNRDAKMPVVTAIGTEKIHGTNASVCYSESDGFWVQSRKNIITPEKDNAGCAFATMANEQEWFEIILALSEEYKINLAENIITVYFEWSGGNIQKKSACTGVDKRAIIFQHFKVSPIEPQLGNDGTEKSAKWLPTIIGWEGSSEIWASDEDKNIFNIMNFPTVSIAIDFDRPDIAQNAMIEMVDIIEKESLVGKSFGQDGNIGEGYVFTFTYKGEILRFKVKGEEHSKGSGKVKTLKPVDEELENKKRVFVNDFACTEGRLEQMFTEIIHSVHNGDETLVDMKDMKDFLSLIHRDIIKEESDRMMDLGLEPKSINGYVSKVAVTFFKSKLDEMAGM